MRPTLGETLGGRCDRQINILTIVLILIVFFGLYVVHSEQKLNQDLYKLVKHEIELVSILKATDISIQKINNLMVQLMLALVLCP